MSHELEYFLVLQKIAKGYQSLDQLRRDSERLYGLLYKEALELAYENIQTEAANAIRGRRRPKA